MIINSKKLDKEDELTFKTLIVHWQQYNLTKAFNYIEKILTFKFLKSFQDEIFYIYFSKIIYWLNNFAHKYCLNNKNKLCKKLIIKTIQIIKDKRYWYVYKLELSTLNIYIFYLKNIKKYHKALNILDKSLNIANLNNDKESMPLIYNNLSVIFLVQKNYIRAYDCAKISSNLFSIMIKEFKLSNKDFKIYFKENIKSYWLSWIHKAKIEKYLDKKDSLKETFKKIESINYVYNLKNEFKVRRVNSSINNSLISGNFKTNKSNEVKINNLIDFYENNEVINKKSKKIISLPKSEKYKKNLKMVKLTEKFFKENNKTTAENFIIKIKKKKKLFNENKFNQRSTKLINNYYHKLSIFGTKKRNKTKFKFTNQLGHLKKYFFNKNIYLKSIIKIQTNFKMMLAKNKSIYLSKKFKDLNIKTKLILKLKNKRQMFNCRINLKEYNAVEIKLFNNNNWFLSRNILTYDLKNEKYQTLIQNLNISLFQYRFNILKILASILKNIRVKFYNDYEIIIKTDNIKENVFRKIYCIHTENDDDSIKYNSNINKANMLSIKDYIIDSVIIIQKIIKGINARKMFRSYVEINPIIIDFGKIVIKDNIIYFIVIFRKYNKTYVLSFLKNNRFIRSILVNRLKFNIKEIMKKLFITDNIDIYYENFLFSKNDKNISIKRQEKKIILSNFRNKYMQINKRIYNKYYDIDKSMHLKKKLIFVGKKNVGKFILLFYLNEINLMIEILLFEVNNKVMLNKINYLIPFFFSISIIKKLFKYIQIENKNGKMNIKFKLRKDIFILNKIKSICEKKFTVVQNLFKEKKFLFKINIYVYRHVCKVNIYYLYYINKILIKVYENSDFIKHMLIDLIEFRFDISYLKWWIIKHFYFFKNQICYSKIDIKSKYKEYNTKNKIKNNLKFINISNNNNLTQDLDFKFKEIKTNYFINSYKEYSKLFIFEAGHPNISLKICKSLNCNYGKYFNTIKIDIKKRMKFYYFDTFLNYLFRKFIFYNIFFDYKIENIKNSILEFPKGNILVNKDYRSNRKLKNNISKESFNDTNGKIVNKLSEKLKNIKSSLDNKIVNNNISFIVSNKDKKKKILKDKLSVFRKRKTKKIYSIISNNFKNLKIINN